MKLDNFTTARCSKCHWIKQFQPGREYDSSEFVCDCAKPEPKPKRKASKPKQTLMGETSGESRTATKADSES